MSLLLALVVGIIVGALGGVLLQENYDLLLLNLCMGVVGSVAGDVVYYFASGETIFLFTLAGFLSQIAGAVLFVLLFGLLHKAAPDSH